MATVPVCYARGSGGFPGYRLVGGHRNSVDDSFAATPSLDEGLEGLGQRCPVGGEEVVELR